LHQSHKWYLDEVFIRIQGVKHYLWRAAAQEGVVLDILVQRRRDAKAAAKRFFRRLLQGLQYVPRVIVTDQLRSYGVAQRKLLPNAEHRQSRYLNNRAETRIVRHTAASARCDDSNHRSKPTTFSPRMHSSTVISIHDDTYWRPRHIARSGLRHSMSGSRTRASETQRDVRSKIVADFRLPDES
jgi:transposase-like protein